jgi:sphingoid base N-palmitoyltransferase
MKKCKKTLFFIQNSPLLRIFYLTQFGYYLQLLVNLVFVDEKLSDFYEMLAHHLITKSLIAFSYVGM